MDMKQAIKARPPIAEAKGEVVAFFESLKRVYITCNTGAQFPPLEFAEYRYHDGVQYLILTPMSIFHGQVADGSAISAFVMDGDSPKNSKKFYAQYLCNQVQLNDCGLAQLAETDRFLGHMKDKGATFFALEMKQGILMLNPSQVYDIAADLTPSFAKTSPNGKARFENSRHVLMEYQDRDVLFNTVVEGDLYYTLTKADSNKMAYINDGGVCKFFDGKGNHFESKMTVLPAEEVQVIFEKLVATNHAFFKSAENLVALSFQK